MTRLIYLDKYESLADLNEPSILSEFFRTQENKYFEDIYALCKNCSLNPRVVLLPEIQVAQVNDKTPFWYLKKNGYGDLQINRYPLSKLKEAIKRLSGGNAKIGRKGLTFGTSAVECALSKTDAAFPGDADAVIVDENYNVRCIIEYKKHTLNSPISDHLAEKYYPHPDGRKYKRLWALVQYFRKKGHPASFFILYYSTKTPYIRLQEIDDVQDKKLLVTNDSGDRQIDTTDLGEISSLIKQWIKL